MRKLIINIGIILTLCIAGHSLYAQGDAETDRVIIEVEAQYPGGFEQLIRDVSRNFEYTEEAQREGLQGTIIVSFNVSEDGTVKNVKVMRGLGHGLDAKALEAVKKLKKFVPAQAEGRNVESYMTLPIRCKLDN